MYKTYFGKPDAANENLNKLYPEKDLREIFNGTAVVAFELAGKDWDFEEEFDELREEGSIYGYRKWVIQKMLENNIPLI